MSHPLRPMHYWTRSGAFAGLEDLLSAMGEDAAPLFKRFGLPPNTLSDPELRIPYRSLCQFLETGAVAWDCPHLGLSLGQVQDLNAFGPIGLVARLSDTVGDALRALWGHMTIHCSGSEWTLQVKHARHHGLAAQTYTPKPGTGAGRQVLEMSMAMARNVIAVVMGNPYFVPEKVLLACDPPLDPCPARQFFCCPVQYGAPETMLLFDPTILGQPTAIRDTAIAPVLLSHLAQLNRQYGEDLVESTRRLISNMLPTRQCTLRVVAECLNLHPRTLQRRLEERGTSFASLLDGHRHTLALDLLSRGTLPLGQIADLLGFADQSVFNQAFRRWTHSTPRQFKKGRV